MPTVLSIDSVNSLLRLNNVQVNTNSSYDEKVQILKNAQLLTKNEQYVSSSNANLIKRDISAPAQPISDIQNKIRFDQIVVGDVNIQPLNGGAYTITFIRCSPFTLYQTWNEKYPELNRKRFIMQQSPFEWVLNFNNMSPTGAFTPTAVMKYDNSQYLFVIRNVSYADNRMVLRVTTADINIVGINSSNVRAVLPLGELNNARFDIDDFSWAKVLGGISGVISAVGGELSV